MKVAPPALNVLCEAAREYGGSDLLLHEGQPPRLRLSGRLAALDHPVLEGDFFDEVWEACGVAPDITDFDGSIVSASGVRFRINLLRQLGSRAAVLRRIRSDIPVMEELGVPVDLLRSWCGRRSGLVLVCGPTGSGKSTTLAAILQWINQTSARHVLTIEDPIEYLFQNDQSVFTQREVGIDTESFAEGMRRGLRQNPDVILVGEIRDTRTAATAIQASETGHLVLATLHSSSGPEAVERLDLLFPPEARDGVRKTLAGQLIGIICQRLLAAVDDGVVLATEYFTNVALVRKYIMENSLAELADFIARADGAEAMDLNASLAGLIRAGRLTEEGALAASDRPHELQRSLRGFSSASRASRV